MEITVSHLLVFMLVMAAATFITRVIPFVLFHKHSDHPLLEYLGRFLPPVLMVLLLVYSFKNETFLSLSFVPEVLGLLVTLVLHLLWRQPLISIVVGTGFYMTLVQTGLLG